MRLTIHTHWPAIRLFRIIRGWDANKSSYTVGATIGRFAAFLTFFFNRNGVTHYHRINRFQIYR